MASKQTTNYGLSQWEATDQVVRLDFNSDNAKIDAALHDMSQTHAADMAELREGQLWGKVVDKTLTSATSSVTLSIPDPGTWQMLSLQFSVSGPRYVAMSLNNGTGFYYNGTEEKVTSYTLIDSTSTVVASGTKVEFYQGAGNGLYAFFQTAFLGADSTSGNSIRSRTFLADDLSLADLTQIVLTGTEDFASGSRFMLYGLKK